MNQHLKDLHQMLLAQHKALSAKLDEETDADDAGILLTEMEEVLHRIDVAQKLLFRASSKALEASIAKVKAADKKFTSAIKAAEKAGDYVKATSQFLKFVDKALDIAKTLAVL